MTDEARWHDPRLVLARETLVGLASRPLPAPATPSIARLQGAHRAAAEVLAARLDTLLDRAPRTRT